MRRTLFGIGGGSGAGGEKPDDADDRPSIAATGIHDPEKIKAA